MRRKRDYQKKDFRNPYFGRKQKSNKSGLAKILIPVFIIIIIFGVYFLNSAEQLQIKDVIVSGNEYINQSEIKSVILEQADKKRWLFLSQKNILFFSKNSAKKELTKKYYFEELKIKKKYFNTIEVSVKEKISSIIWISGEDKYYLDLSGVAFRKVTNTDLVINAGEGDTALIRPEVSLNKYPVIYDLSNNPVTIGQPVISQNQAGFIVGISEELKNNSDFDISHYNISGPKSDEVTLVTNEGWEALFKISDSPENQSDLLLSVLYQKIKDRRNLKYIDLRFGDKVFWQ